MGASASREKFRESVAALIDIDVSPDDAEFWDELWKIPSSTEEVFELISPEAARKLRDERFDNLATLFTQATAQLCQIVETPYSIYFDQALNCVRVLTRILAVTMVGERPCPHTPNNDKMIIVHCEIKFSNSLGFN